MHGGIIIIMKPANRQNGDTAANSNLNLERLATALRQGVKVKDRYYGLRLYKQCLIGSEAVDLIVHLTKTSRQEALMLGRRAATDFHLGIEHVCDTKGHPELEDARVFFRFTNHETQTAFRGMDPNLMSSLTSNTNSDNLQNNNTKSDREIMTLLQQGVSIRDRKFHFRTYKQCFLGTEAVDLLIQNKLAPSRTEAVQLGRRLVRDYVLFEHATREHDFEDK